MRKTSFLSLVFLGTIMSLPRPARAQSPAAQTGVGPVEVSNAIQHDVSPPLRDIPGKPEKAGPRDKPLNLIPRGLTTHQVDPVVQSSAPLFVATTAGLNFAGVGNGDYGFVPNAAPPDTNGAVGATQYVQWVNESFAVFNKTTGAIAPGFPKAGNTLWSGFGGGCEANNDGDPVVQYDKAANRWVLTQFSITTTPYLQCVAVSTTSDATGSYYRYAFSQPNFNDYPKLGVWPDAYYISFNMFSGNTFLGGRSCAFDRTNMLSGNPAINSVFSSPRPSAASCPPISTARRLRRPARPTSSRLLETTARRSTSGDSTSISRIRPIRPSFTPTFRHRPSPLPAAVAGPAFPSSARPTSSTRWPTA